jgi:hypothetical protein
VLAPESVRGFAEIGLRRTAMTVARAMGTLGSPYPRDRRERKILLGKLRGDALDPLDREFYALLESEAGGFQTAADRFAASISRRAWVGSEPADISDYLEGYAAANAPVSAFRLSRCTCSSLSFFLDADDDEQCAKRTCTDCSREHLICDSADYWEEASPARWRCIECGSERANVGVAFSLYDDGEVRWLYVGERCANCGVLGCFTHWKVAYSPSGQLLAQA